MDDAISRHGVMDEISKQQTYKMFEGEDAVYLDANDVGSVIASMPSIQPEIIRCKDCKHYNAGFECLIEGYGIERDKNWYCGDAERRTDE